MIALELSHDSSCQPVNFDWCFTKTSGLPNSGGSDLVWEMDMIKIKHFTPLGFSNIVVYDVMSPDIVLTGVGHGLFRESAIRK